MGVPIMDQAARILNARDEGIVEGVITAFEYGLKHLAGISNGLKESCLKSAIIYVLEKDFKFDRSYIDEMLIKYDI